MYVVNRAIITNNQLQSSKLYITATMTDKETSAAADTAAASTANPPPAPAAEAIEEDDEFEEFEPCHWDKRDEDAEDSQQWQVSYSMMYVGDNEHEYLFCRWLERRARRHCEPS